MLSFLTKIVIISGLLPFMSGENEKTNLHFGRVFLLILVPSILSLIISFVVYLNGWSPIVLFASSTLYFVLPFIMLKSWYGYHTSIALKFSSMFVVVVFLTELAFQLGAYASQNV
ncbi:hypothetical protein [Photobacterium satsumensis]|uniref:hypothetical protein n=1 Tax=Photobacterium satsumensis TaxID=2910239 RepID=UPI003D1217C8